MRASGRTIEAHRFDADPGEDPGLGRSTRRLGRTYGIFVVLCSLVTAAAVGRLLAAGSAGTGGAWVAMVYALGVPLGLSSVFSLGGEELDRRVQGIVLVGLCLLACTLGGILGVEAIELLLFSGLFFQACLLAQARVSSAASGALFLGQALCGLVISWLPDAWNLALFVAHLGLACASGTLLHGRHTRRRVQRDLGHGYDAIAVEDVRGLKSRCLRSLPLAALLFALGIGIQNGGLELNRWAHAPERPPSPSTVEDPLAEGERLRRDAAGESSSGDGDRLGTGERAGRPSFELVATAQRFAEDGTLLEDDTPFRLRRVAYDRWREGSLSEVLERGQVLLDRDDGRADGWVRIESPPEGAEIRRILVHETPQARVRGEVILHRPQGTVAIRAPGVTYDPDGELRLADPGTETVALEYLAHDVRVHPTDLRRRQCRHPDQVQTSLPDHPAIDALRIRAQRIVPAELRDIAVVEAVLEHLGQFQYDLAGTGVPGPEGLVVFMDRRSGYCTHFAQAALVLLRSLGVPTRVVMGYVAREWDAEAKGFEIRHRNLHAWIEVYFEGVGWVPFEATPAGTVDRVGELLTVEDRSREVRLVDWTAMIVDRTGAAAAGRPNALAQLGEAIQLGPVAVRNSVGDAPRRSLGVLGLLLVFLGIVVLGGIGRAAEVVVGSARTRDRSLSAYDRLLRDLSKLGFRKLPGQTPLEFARRVVREGGREHEPLLRITRWVYRRRFRGDDCGPELTEGIREYRQTLRAPGSSR